MTQDEIIRFAIQCRLVTTGNRDGLYMDALTEFANLVAAKALAQPDQEQEPVATVESVATVVSESGNQEVTMSWWHEPALPVGTKLYTHPPQRTWVGLTDEEIQECYNDAYKIVQGRRLENAFYKTIEAKLKERNT